MAEFPKNKPPESFREEETKVTCPACKGNGRLIGQGPGGTPGAYRMVQCFLCKGAGMVSVSKASDYKRKAP